MKSEPLNLRLARENKAKAKELISLANKYLEIPARWTDAWGTEMSETTEHIRRAREAARKLTEGVNTPVVLYRREEINEISDRKHLKRIIKRTEFCTSEALRLTADATNKLADAAMWTEAAGHPRIAGRIRKEIVVVQNLERDIRYIIECIDEHIRSLHLPPVRERRGWREWDESWDNSIPSLWPSPRPYNPNQNTWRRRFRRK